MAASTVAVDCKQRRSSFSIKLTSLLNHFNNIRVSFSLSLYRSHTHKSIFWVFPLLVLILNKKTDCIIRILDSNLRNKLCIIISMGILYLSYQCVFFNFRKCFGRKWISFSSSRNVVKFINLILRMWSFMMCCMPKYSHRHTFCEGFSAIPLSQRKFLKKTSWRKYGRRVEVGD